MFCCLSRKSEKLVPSRNVSHLEPQKIVPAKHKTKRQFAPKNFMLNGTIVSCGVLEHGDEFMEWNVCDICGCFLFHKISSRSYKKILHVPGKVCVSEKRGETGERKRGRSGRDIFLRALPILRSPLSERLEQAFTNDTLVI